MTEHGVRVRSSESNRGYDNSARDGCNSEPSLASVEKWRNNEFIIYPKNNGSIRARTIQKVIGIHEQIDINEARDG
jgi:hypothetical protein